LTRTFTASDGVSLCEVSYRKGIASANTNFSPHSIQPLARPLLASGSTVPGNTPWQPWGFLSLGSIGVQTYIDTSAAGFTRVPCYFAWLEGPLWNPLTLQLVPAVFPSISGESITGFTFCLWLEFPQPATIFELDEASSSAARAPALNFVADPNTFALFAQQQDLYVSWVGCQMPVPISRCGVPAATRAPQASAGPHFS
jgi:hypothetical protein